MPVPRPGVPLKEMSPEQAALGRALLQTELTQDALVRLDEIRSLEDVLYVEENHNPGRDRGKYFFVFFGQPSAKGDWAFRFEGHHISYTFTYHDGNLVASTPQFLGANPANGTWRKVPAEPLKALEDRARAFVTSLPKPLQERAVLPEQPPAEILSGFDPAAKVPPRQGLRVGDLNRTQKAGFEDLLNEYAKGLGPAAKRQRMKRVGKIEELTFVWMGGLNPGDKHYYRIQGANFMIEYDNTQNAGNHIHSVWRDFQNDFGG